MNHDLKGLEQNQDEDDDAAYAVRASPDYHLREDRDVVAHKMIDHIDDIIKILRDVPTTTMDEAKETHTQTPKRQKQQLRCST